MSSTEKIKGAFVPVPTVFDESGELDEKLYAEIIEYFIVHDADALFLMGSFAQGAAMDTGQRKRATEIAVTVAGGRVPIVPNVSAVDPYTSRQLAQHARDRGADAIGMIGPYYYNERTAEELLEHFKMIDRDIEMPLFIHNSRLHQGYAIGPELMAMIK